MVTVFTGGDVHPRRAVLAQLMQSPQVVGGHRFFEPPHVVLGEAPGPQQRLFAAVGAVGVDEQFGGIADRATRCAHPFGVGVGVAPHFHLDPGIPASTQPHSWARSVSLSYEVNPPLP